MSNAYQYLKGVTLNTNEGYPYTSGNNGQSGSCNKDLESGGTVQVTDFTMVPSNEPFQLKKALAQGPVTVAVNASSSVFQQYRSGVITSDSCGTGLNHAVTAVGYGKENGQKYFLVRNSWSTYWGDKGYVKIG